MVADPCEDQHARACRNTQDRHDRKADHGPLLGGLRCVEVRQDFAEQERECGKHGKRIVFLGCAERIECQYYANPQKQEEAYPRPVLLRAD